MYVTTDINPKTSLQVKDVGTKDSTQQISSSKVTESRPLVLVQAGAGERLTTKGHRELSGMI